MSSILSTQTQMEPDPIGFSPFVNGKLGAHSSGSVSEVSDSQTIWSQSGNSSEKLAESTNQVLSRIADLIANVSWGLARNHESHGPAVANQRLVNTASRLVDDIKNTTKAARKALLSGSINTNRSAIDAYSKYSKTNRPRPDLARSTHEFLEDVSRAFESLQPSTSEGVVQAVAILGGLEQRARSLSEAVGSLDERKPIDQTV